MDKKEQGLYAKYIVNRSDGKPVDWAFVLQDTDPLAVHALEAYARAARTEGYEALADDLERKAREMRVKFGVF